MKDRERAFAGEELGRLPSLLGPLSGNAGGPPGWPLSRVWQSWGRRAQARSAESGFRIFGSACLPGEGGLSPFLMGGAGGGAGRTAGRLEGTRVDSTAAALGAAPGPGRRLTGARATALRYCGGAGTPGLRPRRRGASGPRHCRRPGIKAAAGKR